MSSVGTYLRFCACALLLGLGWGCEPSEPDAGAPAEVAVLNAALVQDAAVSAYRDTYVKELASTKNQNSDTYLRVQGLDRQRSIVQFSQAQLVAAAAGRAVTEAALELTVQDVTWIWGQIGAHRMKAASTETGATWQCANDTNVSNSTNDCTGANTWQMSALLPSNLPYVASATDTEDVTNGSTVVRFNVTTDVQAFLAGTQPNNGWLIKVAIEGVPGSVRFRSRESGQPPRLILDLANPVCTPTSSSDTTCNGVDDDCSGTADEDFVASATSCGVGACAANGATSCVAGNVVNTCVPGAPAATDTSCNGIDDDCSGTADEDFVASSVSCGVGACAANGATSCVGGHVVGNCVPGTPAANDASCNGVDDDCNGAADEDFVAVMTSCGLGACGSTGALSCIAGSLRDSCMPGAPASDGNCNGVDDDCDAVADEAYVSVATTCGDGVCATNGATSCVAGTVQDSCTVDDECDPNPGAFTLDSTGDWDGQQIYSALCGEGAWGQTFTLTTPSTVNSFSLFVRTTPPDDLGNGTVQTYDAITFRAQIVAWDANTDTAVGPVLYTSAGTYTTTNTLQEYVFDTDTLHLPAGTYVALANAAGLGNSPSALASLGVAPWYIVEPNNDITWIDAYSGGEFVGSQCTGATNPVDYPWSVVTSDLAFTLSGVAQGGAPNPYIGMPCTDSSECGPGGQCETAFPGGYCFVPCDFGQPVGQECAPGSVCWLGSACVVGCGPGGTCTDPRLACGGFENAGLPPDPFCHSTCIESCVNGATCDPFTNLCF